MSEQPYPESGGLLRAEASRFVDSLFGLAPDGVFRAALLALGAVVSYTTFSPLPCSCERGGLILCGTFRQNVLAFRPRVSQPNKPELRGIVLCGVRTFLLHPAKRDESDSPLFQNQPERSFSQT